MNDTEKGLHLVEKSSADLARLFTPTPYQGSDQAYQNENILNSVFGGASIGVSAAMAAKYFGATGAVTGGIGIAVGVIAAGVSYYTDKEARKEAQKQMQEKRHNQWRAAVAQHKSVVRNIKSGISQQQRQVSEAKVDRIAQAATQLELKYDAQIASAYGKGVINVTAAHEAIAKAGNLEAALAGQERIFEAKLTSLDRIHGLLEEEEEQKRQFGQVSTEHFTKARKEVERYERGIYG